MRRVLALTLVLAAAAVAPVHAASRSVGIDEFRYFSDYVRIDPGDSVTWTNRGDAAHTVTSRRGAPQGFDSGNVDPGRMFSRPFTRPGTYAYVCMLHPGLMSGVVQVGQDRVKPKVTGLSAKAGKKVRVAYRVSEKARVVVKLTRRGKPVRTIRVKGLVEGFVTQLVKRPSAGRYGVVVIVTDRGGNKSTARRTLTVN